MRIVLDMQGVQNGSRHRGIGRYTTSFAKALIRNSGKHEVIILLSSLFPDSIDAVKADFSAELANVKIKIWDGVSPAGFVNEANSWRRQASQLIREAFIASLEPDVLIISSMFEGAGDESITSVGDFCPIFTASILYDLIPLIYKDEYLADSGVLSWYLDKIEHLKNSDVWFAISESSRDEGICHLGLPEDRVENISAAVGPEFSKVNLEVGRVARLHDSFGITRPFLMYSGATDPRKNLNRLIDSYAALTSSVRNAHQLVLAGGMPQEHRDFFNNYAQMAGLRADELVFTGRVTDEEMVALYGSCKAFILPSFHEGFGLPALEAMACGAATIGSNAASIPEVIGTEIALFDPRSVQDMTAKINRVLTDDVYRSELVTHGLEQSRKFSWDRTAQIALAKLESLENEGAISSRKAFEAKEVTFELVNRIARLSGPRPGEYELVTCASSIAQIIPREDIRPRLYVDISELHLRDLRTGIQRVVRSISRCLLMDGMDSYKVEFVYATSTEPYRVASDFPSKILSMTDTAEVGSDEIIDPRDGDIFLGLDFQDCIVASHEEFYRKMRLKGVKVYFVVYDLLPVTLRHIFSPLICTNYENWLRIVTDQDGAICISRSVANELRSWTLMNRGQRDSRFEINWFHLGADIENSSPTMGFPSDADRVLNELTARPTFLVVGTIEPRKGHKQVLDAMERLWAIGQQVNVVFVGNQGWMVDSLLARIRNHPEAGRRLFWLEGISDEYLVGVYAASTCLIAASEGEGFGLPLIEAAQNGLPIIARDIPVFREVAGKHAFYFRGSAAANLATAIQEWLNLFQAAIHPGSEDMPWMTWSESTQQLIGVLFKDEYRTSRSKTAQLA